MLLEQPIFSIPTLVADLPGVEHLKPQPGLPLVPVIMDTTDTMDTTDSAKGNW